MSSEEQLQQLQQQLHGQPLQGSLPQAQAQAQQQTLQQGSTQLQQLLVQQLLQAQAQHLQQTAPPVAAQQNPQQLVQLLQILQQSSQLQQLQQNLARPQPPLPPPQSQSQQDIQNLLLQIQQQQLRQQTLQRLMGALPTTSATATTTANAASPSPAISAAHIQQLLTELGGAQQQQQQQLNQTQQPGATSATGTSPPATTRLRHVPTQRFRGALQGIECLETAQTCGVSLGSVVTATGAPGDMYTVHGPDRAYSEIAKTLPQQGVSVLQVEFWQQAGNDVKHATEDVLECVGWVLNKGGGPVMLIGWAMGAAAVVETAARIQRHIKETQSSGSPFINPFCGVVLLAPPQTGVNGATLEVAIRTLSGLKTPLLIIHGENDQVNPPAVSQELLDWAADPKTLVLLPSSGHNVEGVLPHLLGWAVERFHEWHAMHAGK
eukprot:TRINITY_DN1368_c0_g1_i2.p1 TRINITY_DN1368_c0_g1~~TRINITY_DN1368_c0_g1_i2.p1  ORF type:complete len:435 (+),score=102.31 TRINITY_DN1368_c0_g1_i2:212-1516(+)